MKVKNIMFSGFAAAILMGVGAANAAPIANPVTLADTGYVDAKVNLVAGQKEAVKNKVSEITDANRDSADLYTSVKAVTGYVADITSGKIEDLGALAKKNTIANADVADDAAIAQSKIAGLVDALAAKADKSVVDGLLTGNDSVANQIANALKNEDGTAKYETAGAAAAAEAAAKEYADGLAGSYDAQGSAAKALTDAKTYTNEQVAIVDGKVAANTSAIEKLNGEGEGSVKSLVDNAVKDSGHAQKTYVDDELDKKLDKTAIDNAAGTYMVTSDGAGGFTYTKVLVATGVDGEGKAEITE